MKLTSRENTVEMRIEALERAFKILHENLIDCHHKSQQNIFDLVVKIDALEAKAQAARAQGQHSHSVLGQAAYNDPRQGMVYDPRTDAWVSSALRAAMGHYTG